MIIKANTEANIQQVNVNEPPETEKIRPQSRGVYVCVWIKISTFESLNKKHDYEKTDCIHPSVCSDHIGICQ